MENVDGSRSCANGLAYYNPGARAIEGVGLAVQGGADQKAGCGLEAHLEEWAGGRFDAEPVAGTVAPGVRHVVGDEGEVTGVDGDTVRAEDGRDLRHDGGSCGLDTEGREHVRRGVGGEPVDVDEVTV